MTDLVKRLRDWTEDLSHENGNYLCQCISCGIEFHGHKRRNICKVCADALDSSNKSAQAKAILEMLKLLTIDEINAAIDAQLATDKGEG